MDNLYMKGELLQIHTKSSEVFEGRFYNMNSDRSKISLYDVKELPQGKSNEGVCHYYDTEVHNIIKLKETSEIKHLKITQKECEEIIKVSKTYIFINQLDNTYHEAIADLNQYSYIALSTDGASMGRKCKMPFLVLSTPQQIYIFDVKVMQYQAFDGGLRKLLENESPKKIIHDCRKISDCLYHKHSVKLKSVFDTQVADLFITKAKTGCMPTTVKSLSECYNTYLGLQLNVVEDKVFFLNIIIVLTELDIVECTERPLPLKIKETLAKNIAYLHRASELIHEEMMLPFHRGVECFVDNLRSCDDFKAWELCSKYNQLPKEFKSAIEF